MVYELTCERSMVYRELYEIEYKNRIFIYPQKIKKMKIKKYGEVLIVENNGKIFIVYNKNFEEKQNNNKIIKFSN